MARTHSAKIAILLNIASDEIEIVAEIEFTIRPGSPATWTDPSDPAEIEFGKIEIEVSNHRVLGGKVILPAPDWLADIITNSAAVYEQCGEAAGWGEDDGPDPDDAYDRKRDEGIVS